MAEAKFLVMANTSPRHNETEPNGPKYYQRGQVIEAYDNTFKPGDYWTTQGNGIVVEVEDLTPQTGAVYAESEYADQTDLDEWEIVLEENESPPLTRKRKWLIDIDGLIAWWESSNPPLAPDGEIKLREGELTEWTSRATELPKTRWTKAEWEAS